MSTITRYVLFDFIRVFVVTLFILTPILLFSLLGFELRHQGIGPSAMLKIMPYILPSAMYICIPAATLFASVTVFGRLSRENELTAIKAMGVSPMAIIWPTLFLSVLLSVATLWLNDLSVSWGRAGVYRIVLSSLEKTVFGMIKSRGQFDNGRVTIIADVDGNRLIRPHFILNGGENQPIVTLVAESAFFKCDPLEEKLTLMLKNGSWDRDGKIQLLFKDEFTWDLSLTDLTKKEREQGKPSGLPLAVISDELQKQIEQTELRKEELAVKAMLQLNAGSMHSIKTANWNHEMDSLNNMEKRSHRLRTEPYRRWANGFSCFGFAILGIPLAIWMKNSDMWTSFGMCFLPTLAVYIPLVLFGVDRAKSGAFHPSIVWVGNIVVVLFGVMLFRRALRH